MSKGGARGRSGPPQDPNALRRDRDKAGDWTLLPPDGRQGDPPEWPLSEMGVREAVLWAEVWRLPQAVEWERNRQSIEVALYVRTLVDAESPRATSAVRTLVRQQQEALGVSMPGMLRNKWRIGHPEQAEGRPAPAASAKERLKLVEGGAS